MRTRITFVAVLGAAFFLLVLGRLVQLAVVEGGDLARMAAAQHREHLALRARRGTIVDRRGVPLALTVETQSLYLHPRKFPRDRDRILALSAAVHEPPTEVEAKLRRQSPFVWLKRQTDHEEAAAVAALGLDGVGSLDEGKRVYPHGSLAAPVLGFAGVDLAGLEGLELFYDAYLKGRGHRLWVERDAWGRTIFLDGADELPRGATVELTLSADLQHVAETELRRAVAATRARAGSVIVLDPRTGEILALAQVPTFNPNRPGDFPASARRNRAVADCFEPGSTLKAVLAAAALEEEIVHADEQFFCENGRHRLGRRTIHDHRPFGWLSFAEAVQKSSNICLAKVGERLGKERYYGYLRRFGFGEPTGVDLPGEISGIVPPLARWSALTLATTSFGQGIAVTPIQLVRAVAAVANGGLLLRPYVVRRVTDSQGRVLLLNRPTLVTQVIRPGTARALTAILEQAVEAGTGGQARMEGFRVAGKTGTAQKVHNGRYAPGKRVASFVGFVPADDPRLAIVVIVDEPAVAAHGGTAAAPAFREIALQGLKRMGVRPQTPEPAVTTAEFTPGDPGDDAAGDGALDLRGLSLREAMVQASRRGLEIEARGNGYVASQRPLPGGRSGYVLELEPHARDAL